MKSVGAIERFYSLDVLRGIAALSVVLWHWQHFFYHGTEPGSFDIRALPLFHYFPLLYTKGWLAVDLFFGLSGFIFYWLYSEKISRKQVSLKEFAILRFSRLYPLHCFTLLLVAIGQLVLYFNGEQSFVYENNDLKHLLLNLTFTSSWGFESGYSFNAPSWSVSTEVLLYLTFFLASRYAPKKFFVLALFSLIGFTVLAKLHSPIGRGVGSFYLGGCVLVIYRAVTASSLRHYFEIGVCVLCLLAWGATVLLGLEGFESVRSEILEVGPKLGQLNGMTANNMHTVWVICAVFPLTVLTLALLERYTSVAVRRISFIGDISYSSYLLHFPLQLAFHLCFANPSLYYRPELMALFFALLITLSLCSYHFFEVPLQKRIRKILPKQPSQPVPLVSQPG
ncbi:acyltransferase family protein [Pseudoxanthomonas sp. UTMC 1351]|uniref:acyltransferase family protein n=1 Tax=Pseudoxanthomonas sp. UTMC 1351 TaxID=2695853 RepID=UPI0034CD35BC